MGEPDGEKPVEGNRRRRHRRDECSGGGGGFTIPAYLPIHVRMVGTLGCLGQSSIASPLPTRCHATLPSFDELGSSKFYTHARVSLRSPQPRTTNADVYTR